MSIAIYHFTMIDELDLEEMTFTGMGTVVSQYYTVVLSRWQPLRSLYVRTSSQKSTERPNFFKPS